ncbi:serine/threonine-protein kinase [Roseomonas genomospecies 6]|uniref:Serine/threonine protein kinase n=1 Tax=Roseomonas genomospecies 6 TaxID=214106 RepID=A0A9W7U0Z3_9PROT|nr:serine/threonine-protein kinase [Roseomonas genomospecies 6]KAA0683939.1 serine/threonine protein kinase [Roseomonas genomospecies 6]
MPASRTPATAGSSGSTGTLDEAVLCQTLADHHGGPARMVVGIALRQHLDGLVLTPTELIHNNRHLKALLAKTTLVESALGKVATVQARLPGQEAKARRRALDNAVAETSAKARAVQLAFTGLPRGRALIDSILRAPPGRSPTGDAAFDLRAAVCLELEECRTWTSKLDALIQLFPAEREDALSAALDEVIGDLLASPAATQELLGSTPAGGSPLVALCDLLFGRVPMEAFGPNRLGVLNGLFRQGRLPAARDLVLERIRRQLRAPQPLGRGTAEQEADLLRMLIGHLLTPAGLTGGAAMADALTVRYSRRLEQGGATAYRRSIVGLSETQPDLICRIHYLAAVSAVPAAERHIGEIVDALDAALKNELLVENMVLQTPDTALLRRSLTGAVEAIRLSGLREDERERIAARAASVVDEFARRGRLIQRLRQIEPLPRRRTIRLAELACSGLVSDDGALSILRQHILDTARQPQFQAELAAAQGDDIAQAEVRRLYELLDRLRQMPLTSAKTLPQDVQPGPASTPAFTYEPCGATALPTVPAPAVRKPALPVSTAAVTVTVPRPSPSALCPGCFVPKAPREVCRECGYPVRVQNRSGVHLLPGTRLLSRYLVGRVLGQGGFGATYLGWDERLQVKVAVKEFYPANLVSRATGSPGVVPFSDEHALSFSTGLAKFLEEARMLARLREVKEVVSVQDFFGENGTAYIVMELLDGRTLKRHVVESGGRIDARKTLSLLSPIMKALHAVHEQGLVHRDISPDNIFLTSGGDRKLLDFGAARHAAGMGADLTVILKPGYAPPEQYAPDGKQGPWTDVYALCATAYYALTGKTPPDATSRFMSDRVPRLAESGATVAPGFEKVLLSGLSMRWQERPRSMRDLLVALTGTLNGP